MERQTPLCGNFILLHGAFSSRNKGWATFPLTAPKENPRTLLSGQGRGVMPAAQSDQPDGAPLSCTPGASPHL